MERVWAEPDHERLLRRLRTVTGGDLTSAQLVRLIDGEVALAADLPLTSQVAVKALVVPNTTVAGQLEKMVGTTIDYVPISYLDLARKAANAVGRVVDEDRRAVGTGTMISPRLLLTNNHVTPDAATAAGQILQMGYELNIDGAPAIPSEFTLDPDTFFWTCPQNDLDATVVAVGHRVSGCSDLPKWGFCPLSAAGDKHATRDFVTVVQHPEGDHKQIALRENRVIGRGKGGITLHYGADTLPGSSGSPVFNDQFELVALHHAGGAVNEQTLEDGSAVPDDSNEGIRISAIVARLRERLDEVPEPFHTVLAGALDLPVTGPQGPVGKPEALAPPDAALGGAAVLDVVAQDLFADGVVQELSVPVRVRIEVAQPVAARTLVVAEAPVVAPLGAVERNMPPSEDYERRSGYDPGFLEVDVPLPGLAETLALAAIPDGAEATEDGAVLRYLHFSLVQNANRRMPIFTAVNIDGRRSRDINRTTGEIEASEKWYIDPRLKPQEQLDQSIFEKQVPRTFDRGHMVRRLDPAWGSPTTARKASDDTFHFTNCCPQISAFNQRAKLWAGIENYVLDNAKAEKARVCVFTGPILADDDPDYRGVGVPRAFWKVLVRVEDSELRCTAFLADQSDLLSKALEGGVEAFDDIDRVKEFQTRIANLAERTGLDFGSLAQHDTAAVEAIGAIAIQNLDEVHW